MLPPDLPPKYPPTAPSSPQQTPASGSSFLTSFDSPTPPFIAEPGWPAQVFTLSLFAPFSFFVTGDWSHIRISDPLLSL